MTRLALLILLLAGLCALPASALDPSEQSVSILSSGPQSWDSCVQERGGYFQGDADNETFNGGPLCDPVLAGGGRRHAERSG
jgi:hypothetical protein